MGPACKGASSRGSTPDHTAFHYPVGVLLVPGQVLDNFLWELDQRLTDRDRANRFIQQRPNEAANTLKKLIQWESTHEPVQTCELSSSQVKEFIAAPMIIPACPAHSQGVESVVKKVTFG